MTSMALIEMGKQWLEHSPQTKPGAPDLLGFTGPVGFVCNDCAGRIIGRGCNLKMLASAPLWKPAIRPGCSLCEGGNW